MIVNLAELRALEAKATLGPWLRNHRRILPFERPHPHAILDCEFDAHGFDYPTLVTAQDNAAFLVALRNAAPDLIALLEEAQKLLVFVKRTADVCRDDVKSPGGLACHSIYEEVVAFLDTHFAPPADGGKE